MKEFAHRESRKPTKVTCAKAIWLSELTGRRSEMRTSNMKNYLMSFASVSALAFAATPAIAQDTATDDDELEEIVVTGIRASIMSSVERKRSSSSIVEAISAEDIGKLPDASIAEAIARLPGLAAQRLDGRANVISIRGLAPDFTTTTLNGREQVSANNGRAVEYDQFPSELINGVTIYKTPDASLTSQAVGGTVDLQTISPLKHGKRALVFNLRGEYADLGALNAGTTATGYRGSFSYVDQFADDTIGIAIGYSRMMSPTQEERWNSWGFPGAADGNLVIGGAKPYVKSNELTRDGFLGVFEYEPDENFRTSIDAYYSKFDDEQTLRGIEIPLAWSGAQLQDGYTVTDGLITEGQWNGTEVVVRNDFVNREAETFAIGWNTEYQLNDNWRLEADLSYSSVDRIESNMETYSGTGRGSGVGATDDLGFAITPDGGFTFTPGLDYSDPSLIQLGGPLSWGWGLFIAGTYPADNAQDGFINAPETDDELSAIRLSAEQTIENDWLSSVEYGVRFSKREKTLLDQGYFLTLNEYPADVAVPSQFLLEPTSLDFIGMGDVLSYDAQALFESGAYVLTDEALSTQSRLTNSWTVSEEVFNAYIQANIETESVTGNIGVQAVHTDQSSDGWAAQTVQDADGNNIVVATEVTEGKKYWDFLPSLNLSFHLNDDNKLRLGVAQVLARPPMADMNAGFGFGFDQTNLIFTGGGGNPQLRPFKTWQFDLSYETYFGEGGYASIAGFYKEITSFPFSSSAAYDFSDILGPLGEDLSYTDGDGNEVSLSPIGRVDFKDNIDGGHIYGVELSTSIPLGMMSEALDGFGFLGSASFTSSQILDPNSGDEITLPGLSKTVLNGTMYYEKNGFAARASVRHRSKFLGEVSALSLTRVKVDVEAETIVDAQVSYDLSEVGIDGLSVLFQVNNLTNQEFTTFYNGDARQVRDFQNYGRTFLFGLNYKM
jgi:iron complex outermembrane receptor protein